MQFLCKLLVVCLHKKPKHPKMLRELHSCGQSLAASPCVTTYLRVITENTIGDVTVLTLSPLNSFCLVAVVPERRRGLGAPRAGLRPDWRRLLQGRGLTTERRRWPLTFSVGLRPEGTK